MSLRRWMEQEATVEAVLSARGYETPVVTVHSDSVNIIVIRRGVYYPSWAENLHVLYCIAAIAAVMILSVKLSFLTESKLFRLCDRASYNVYLIHPLFIYMTDSWLYTVGMTSLTGRFCVRLLAVTVLSVGGCMLWELAKDKAGGYIGSLKKR